MAGFVCDGAPLPEAAQLVRETGAGVACFWFWDCAANAALKRRPGALWFISSARTAPAGGCPAALLRSISFTLPLGKCCGTLSHLDRGNPAGPPGCPIW